MEQNTDQGEGGKTLAVETTESPRPALAWYEITCASHSHTHRVEALSVEDARTLANKIYGMEHPVQRVSRISVGESEDAFRNHLERRQDNRYRMKDSDWEPDWV